MERTRNELLLKEKEIELKERDTTIQIKDIMAQLKEKEHQNELLLMKTQLLELQLSQLTQVSKSKVSSKNK